MDNELKVVVWDDWLAEATGLEADLVLGQRIDRLYPQLSGSRFLVMVRAALQKDVAGVLSQRVYNHLLPLYKNRTATQVGGPL
ncbi:MAG: hypothetical protein QNJ78_09660 [Gammaproteobacteria bacterium]|nr:hypothetical protein [Gammaproteobacteria bacterium]